MKWHVQRYFERKTNFMKFLKQIIGTNARRLVPLIEIKLNHANKQQLRDDDECRYILIELINNECPLYFINFHVDACIVCDSEHHVDCVTDPISVIPRNCRTQNQSGCFTRIVGKMKFYRFSTRWRVLLKIWLHTTNFVQLLLDKEKPFINFWIQI